MKNHEDQTDPYDTYWRIISISFDFTLNFFCIEDDLDDLHFIIFNRSWIWNYKDINHLHYLEDNENLWLSSWTNHQDIMILYPWFFYFIFSFNSGIHLSKKFISVVENHKKYNLHIRPILHQNYHRISIILIWILNKKYSINSHTIKIYLRK